VSVDQPEVYDSIECERESQDICIGFWKYYDDIVDMYLINGVVMWITDRKYTI